MKGADDGKSAGAAEVVSRDEGDATFPGSESEADGATAGEAPLDTRKLLELWDGFVTFVRQKKLRLGVSLISGKIHAFDGATLTLRFARSFGPQREQVTKPENMDFLRRMLSKYFGREIEVVCFQEGDEREARRDQKKKKVKAPGDSLRGVAEEKKPLVKKLLDEFDGEIIRYNP